MVHNAGMKEKKVKQVLVVKRDLHTLSCPWVTLKLRLAVA